MNDPAEWRGLVLKTLADVAPESSAVTLDAARPIRDQIDFDSVDFLNFVLALGQAAGIDVPDADWPRLASVEGCARYLAGRGAAAAV